MFNCCDIDPYLSSLPTSWRKPLSALLCRIIETTEINISCDLVKGCETLTSIEEFKIENQIITLKYKDERGNINILSLSLPNQLIYEFENGLTFTDKVRLGGELNRNTKISLLEYILSFDGENIYLDSYPSDRNDSNPINFLNTDENGKLKSSNLQNSVESITNTYLNTLLNNAYTNIFNTNPSICIPENWSELTPQQKLEQLLLIINNLCNCHNNEINCTFTGSAVQIPDNA